MFVRLSTGALINTTYIVAISPFGLSLNPGRSEPEAVPLNETEVQLGFRVYLLRGDETYVDVNTADYGLITEAITKTIGLM